MKYQNNNDPKCELWQFVCSSEDNTTAPPIIRVNLKGQNGKIINITQPVFLTDYSLVDSEQSKSNCEAETIKEILNSIRYTGTIRFVAFPFLLSAFAVLANAAYIGKINPSLIAVTGLGLSLVAVIFEIIFSWNLICWWNELGKLAKNTSWNMLVVHRHKFALLAARAALFAPYAAAFAFWSYKVLNLQCWRLGIECGNRAVPFMAAAFIFVASAAIATYVWSYPNRKLASE